MIKFTPFPELITDRLLLRKVEVSDWEQILFLRSDPTINKFIKRSEESKTKCKADALKFINMINQFIESDKSVLWGITILGSPVLVGSICLWNFSEDQLTAETGYDLSPKFQGKGLMSEALGSVLSFGFNKLNLTKIEAFTHNQNVSSISLLKKNGFALVDHKKDDGNSDNFIFEIVTNL